METYNSLSKELKEKTALIRSTPKLSSTKKILVSLHQRVKVVTAQMNVITNELNNRTTHV